MAEGTSVGRGYVEIVGDFSPLHRQLEQFRTVWRRHTSGLGVSLNQALRPAVTGASRDIAQAGRAADTFGAGLRSTDRSARTTAGSVDRLARSTGHLGDEMERTRKRVHSTDLLIHPLRTKVGDLASTMDLLRRRLNAPNAFGAAGMRDLSANVDGLRASAARGRSDVDSLRLGTDRLARSLESLRRLSAGLPRTLSAAGMPELARDFERAGRGAEASHTGFRRGLASLREWSRASVRARGDALRLERAQIGLRLAVQRHGEGSLQARDAQLRLDQVQRDSARSSGLLARSFAALGSRTTVVNQRFQLLRNMLVTLKWPAIITGAGLAAQALSALGAAAVALTAAVGPAVGVLGALPGALAAAAQGFGAFKLATMGVGGALREQLRAQTAVTAGAGQATAANRAQADASRRLADAEDALGVARVEAARALVDKRHEVARATIDEQRATWELRDARAALQALQSGPDELDLADARDRTADATRGITEAELEYREAIQRTNAVLFDPNASPLEQAQVRADLADAEDRVGDARRSLTRATRDLHDLERGPSRRDLAKARLDVRDAEARHTEAIITRKRETRALQDLEARGIDKSAQVVQAQRDLADAARAVADASADMASAQAGAAGATANLNEEFNRLPRSAQGFVRTLLGLKPRFDELRAVAADGLFPGARAGLLSAMRSFEPVRRVVSVTARALGGLADAAGRLVGSAGFGRDLQLIGTRNAGVIRRVGRASILVADALRHVMVAAGPLLGWLSRVAVRWGEYLRGSARAGRETGRLARFFERTRAVLERLGSITGNVARAFRGIGRAAAPLGREILAALDRASGGFARWTNSFSGQNRLRRYFDDSRPAIFEMGRLLRDITAAFFRLGSQPGVARLLRQVRTEMLPALEQLLRVLQQTFGPALVRALTSIVKLFSELAGAGGVLATMVKLVDGIASGFTWMLRHVPGFRSLTFAVIALGGALTGLKILGVVTGFSRLARTIARVTLAYRGLNAGAAAASVVASSGVAATGAAQVAASGRLAALFSPAGMMRAAGGRASIALAGSRLGSLLGANITAGVGAALGGRAAGGAAGGAVGGAAAGGLAGSLRGGLTRAVKAGGLIGAGFVAADAIMDEASNRMAERSRDLVSRLRGMADVSFGETLGSMVSHGTGGDLSNTVDSRDGLFGSNAFRESESARNVLAVYQRMLVARVRMSRTQIDVLAAEARSLDLTRSQRAEIDRMISILRSGARLRIGVNLDAGMDHARRQMTNAFRLLRSGALSNLRDILKVSRRNMGLIAEILGTGTEAGRRAAARNMRLTADAIATQMRRSGRVTDEGVQRIIRLLRNADLISPTRALARDFGREWARGMDSTKEITRRGLQRMLAEARKMPGPMRKVALDTWLSQLEAARKNRTITVREFEFLRSRVASEFTGMRTASREAATNVPKNIGNMTTAATDAFSVLTGNTNKALTAFGVRPLTFRFEKVRAQRRQRGGQIIPVPGRGSGDKVPALLEPGEVVVNREAVKAMGGAHRVDRINKLIPRFGGRPERHQTGGIAGGSFNVDGARSGFVPFMNYLNSLFGPIYVMSGLRPGSTVAGSGAPSNHASGRAVDISTQQNGLNFVTAPTEAAGNANLNATGVAAKRMDALYAHMARFIPTSRVPGDFLWRTLQGGNHFNHIHRGITSGLADSAQAMAQFLSTLPKGAGFGALQRLLLAGPDGPLKRLGQAAIDKLYKGANAYITSQSSIPTFGTGRVEPIPHAGGRVSLTGRVSTFGPPTEGSGITAAGGSSSEAGLALNLQPGTREGWDNATTDSWMSRRRAGNPAKFLVTIGGNRSVLPVVDKGPNESTGRAIDVTGAGSYQMGIDPFAFPTDVIGTAVQVAQRGGIVGVLQTLQRGGIAGGIDRIARILRKPLPRRKLAGLISRTMRLIQGIGAPVELQSKLTELSNQSDIWAEFASRAGSLSYEMLYAERTPILNPDGTPVLDAQRRPTFHEPGDPILDAERRPMTFFAEVNGKTEEGWTNSRLGALFDLRNKLVQTADAVRTEQGRVARLITQARERIAEIQRLIRRAARRRRDLRRQIARTVRDIAKSQRDLTDAREDLDRYRRHPRRNASKIRSTQRRIAGLVEGIAGLGERRDRLQDRVRVIDGEQQDRVRVRGQLFGVLGDATQGTGLLGRERAMNEYLPGVLGTGGDNFKGLVSVQGLGGPEGLLSALPSIGELGGEILDAQLILRQLGVKPNPVPLPEPVEADQSASDAERAQLLEQLLRESQQREGVANAQFATLRDFRLEGFPPFGGSFATGGVVPGAVGEARTIIAHGGERVLSVDEQRQGGVGQVVVVVEDGAVDVRKIRAIADERVQVVTRQQARSVSMRTPGSVLR